jgi:DNA processing protein
VGYTHRLFFTEALPNQAALCFSSQHLPLYSTSMNSREALVALNMIPHVGPVRYRQLLDSFGDPMSILTASKDKLLRVNSVSEVTAESIATWESGIDLSGELKRIKEFGCQIVVQEDENYPELLRQIYDPPLLLYVKGTLAPKDKNSVAIVGSRMTTSYGTSTARKLGYQLSFMGVTVISGGARGIDTAAHQGALSAKGRTIAVLGTGINQVFPPENAALFEKIISNGALITQFPFNRPADKQSFPIRNRIVAGMSLGTVVVEANLTSGALITANFAVEYGRQVFAVPGQIDSPRSKGCHDLIKKGAKLCEGAEDIVTEFEYLFPTTNKPPGVESGALPGLTLSDNEKLVYEALSLEELSIDDIIAKTGLPASAVSVALLMLEMKKLVKQMPGKLFSRYQRE